MRVSFWNSVGYAFEGVVAFFKTERNGRRQLIVTMIVLLAGWFFQISRMEWIVVTACIILVISMEMINAALEKICDLVTTEIRPEIKLIKDISAGAVLWSAIGASIIGAIIFIPYILLVIGPAG